MERIEDLFEKRSTWADKDSYKLRLRGRTLELLRNVVRMDLPTPMQNHLPADLLRAMLARSQPVSLEKVCAEKTEWAFNFGRRLVVETKFDGVEETGRWEEGKPLVLPMNVAQAIVRYFFIAPPIPATTLKLLMDRRLEPDTLYELSDTLTNAPPNEFCDARAFSRRPGLILERFRKEYL